MPKSLFRFQQPEMLLPRDKRVGLLILFAVLFLCWIFYQSLSDISFQLSSPQSIQLSTSGTRLMLKNESPAKHINTDFKESAPELAIFFFHPIPVNFANAALLETINGIGPSMASQLVKVRKARGKFHSADELATVPGIGPKRASRLAEKLSFQTEP